MSTQGLSLPQQVALTIAPALTGVLSFCGSLFIIQMIVMGKKWKHVKYRILLGVSLSDIVSSLVFVFWSLPIPEGTPGIWGAIGNKRTCDFQGTMLTLGTLGSYYNGALCGYYWLTICYQMSEIDIARRFEKYAHGFSILWPFATAFAALGQDFYGPSALGCWMTPTPLFCNRDDGVDCIRGRYAYLYAWVYVGVPKTLLGCFIGYTMYKIYSHVRTTMKKIARILNVNKIIFAHIN